MKSICTRFHISEQEYEQLDKEFGKLAHHAAWELKRCNHKNNFIDDQEDVVQDLRIALMRAGAYYKRQTYIESCFKSLEKYIKDDFINLIYYQLKHLWDNKTRHGANKQKFGEYQELILDILVSKLVPENERPSRSQSLILDAKFRTYCKQITWNEQKRIGKRITRDKSWRVGLASLNEFDYLASAR